MSDEEKSLISAELKTLRDILKWVLGGVVALLLGGIAVAVTDHFLLQDVAGDVAAMKPRLEVIAWKVFPDTGGHR